MTLRAPVLEPRGVRLHEAAASPEAAVHRCADVLEELGAVRPGYREAMLARESMLSTYVGEGVALPHGLDESRSLVVRDTIAVLRFPDGVDWNGYRATLCVAIAARGDGHVAVLSALAHVLLDPERAAALRGATDPAEIVAMFDGGEER
jgi:mannitol PTS system EIIA component